MMSLLSRIANVFRRGRLSRKIDKGFAAPIEDRRPFGSLLRQREGSHDARVIGWIDSLRADAVFGWRQLNKHKVTSVAAVLSVGLAIGACTAAFRLIDALFLRPLPISDPQNLYVISRLGGGFGDGWEHMRFRMMRAAMKDQADLIAVSFPEQTDLSYASDHAPSQGMEKAYVAVVWPPGRTTPAKS